MEKADLLAFPPTRIHRHRRMKAKARKPIATKKSPAVIAWTGLVLIVRCVVPAAVYIAAGGTVYRWLGL